MTKWILCFTAMISFTALATPSKEEVNVIQEFTKSIHTELKTEINDFSKQKVESTARLNVSNTTKQNEEPKTDADFFANVTYTKVKNAE